MKKLSILFLCGIFLVGCDKGRVGYGVIIPKEDQEKAAKFIAEVCEKANPKSDEEGEDLVKQAEETALQIYGKKTVGIWDNRDFTPYDNLSDYDKKRCDQFGKDGSYF